MRLTTRTQGLITSLAFCMTALLLALLPFHAFLYTFFKSFFWNENWTIFVQAWKEILVGFLISLAGVQLFWKKSKSGFCQTNFQKLRKWWANQQFLIFPQAKSFWLASAFVLLAFFYFLFGENSWPQKLFGFRASSIFFVAFLALTVFTFANKQVEQLKKIVLVASSLVLLFALAQKFILPADFLVNFGYSENISAWLPGGNLPQYHIVGSSELIRLQATFSSPNHLAAFILVILPLAVTLAWRAKTWGWQLLGSGVALSGLLVLLWTYSRSAWLGGLAILLTYAVTSSCKKLKFKPKLIIGGILATLLLGGLAFSTQNFKEIFIRFESSLGHFTKPLQALELSFSNPAGLGLGSSGGASRHFDPSGEGIIAENYYLQNFLELGWLGGFLFLILFYYLLRETKNSAVFYSLIGIAVMLFFNAPLEDSPTALTLFLLAGLEINKRFQPKLLG